MFEDLDRRFCEIARRVKSSGWDSLPEEMQTFGLVWHATGLISNSGLRRLTEEGVPSEGVAAALLRIGCPAAAAIVEKSAADTDAARMTVLNERFWALQQEIDVALAAYVKANRIVFGS